MKEEDTRAFETVGDDDDDDDLYLLREEENTLDAAVGEGVQAFAAMGRSLARAGSFAARRRQDCTAGVLPFARARQEGLVTFGARAR